MLTVNLEKVLPNFNHPEIEVLYQYGLRIPHDKLQEIIALPRASLIEDLERILIDGVERYDYFSEGDWEEENNNFVLHSIMLLKEIKAEDSLEKIIDFLKGDKDFLEFWLGDHITDSLWQCFYTLGFNQTDILKQLMLMSEVDTYVKTSASEALIQIVINHPERRQEILYIYSDVFNIYAQADPDDDLIDPSFLGLSISDAMDCNLNELLPIIKILYEKEYVDTFVNGYYEDVEKWFQKKNVPDYKRKILNIFELYDDVINTWAGYKGENNSFQDFNYSPILPVQAVSTKIGRNDPCPCGSGKKYKKCHYDEQS